MRIVWQLSWGLLFGVMLTVWAPRRALAGYVVHPAPNDPNPPAVVAISAFNNVLDRFGQCWGMPSWSRDARYDPPMPLSDVAFWEGGWLVTTAGEVFIWDFGGYYSVGFPPSVSSAQDAAPSASAGLRAAPNPTSDEASISFSLPSAGPVQVRFFDASGRLVRTLLDGELPAGPMSLTWDGRDDRGEDMPAGVYFSRVETAVGTIAGRVVIAR